MPAKPLGMYHVHGPILEIDMQRMDSGQSFKGEAENHLSQPIKAPMSDSEFRRFMDCSGRIIQMSEFKRSVYMGGLEPCLRKVAWRLLLNVYPAEMTGKERIALLESKSLQYTDMRDAWKKAYLEARLIEEQLASLALVSVDVVRTDRSKSRITTLQIWCIPLIHISGVLPAFFSHSLTLTPENNSSIPILSSIT
ncbi:unnamed protein product [Protopolystoma xenopodis]|uniref:Rab-GAP TBC domain-containing protein n=1 Tax=Protopolystoma xenopodis TaxID=117903 RepID=A0A448XHY6_9PLAT|nr:unnamed protein product [Protopolystoma xenopodis]